MTVKRIFLLSNQSLLSQGVEILLRQDQGVELVGEETEVERAIERIQALDPDVVLVEQEPPAGDPAAVIMRILNAVPNTKIVGVHLADNTIRVYRGERRTVRAIGDLLQVIKDDPRRDESHP
jgi:DNA-binding NarL/FixJ family response regulator